MNKFKIEIIDNQIYNYYEYIVYKWKKVSKWYQIEKYDWCWEHSHTLGKNYICPEIYQKRITIEDMFEREVKRQLEIDGLNEVHRIMVTKH
jgi:hypothetical protein